MSAPPRAPSATRDSPSEWFPDENEGDISAVPRSDATLACNNLRNGPQALKFRSPWADSSTPRASAPKRSRHCGSRFYSRRGGLWNLPRRARRSAPCVLFPRASSPESPAPGSALFRRETEENPGIPHWEPQSSTMDTLPPCGAPCPLVAP